MLLASILGLVFRGTLDDLVARVEVKSSLGRLPSTVDWAAGRRPVPALTAHAVHRRRRTLTEEDQRVYASYAGSERYKGFEKVSATFDRGVRKDQPPDKA